MPLNDERTVRPDYWYTGAHLDELGTKWQNEEVSGEKRIYKPAPQRAYATTLNQQDIDSISEYPCKILLPFNKDGNHWTAFAVIVNKGKDGKNHVNIQFTDSLSQENNLNQQSPRVQEEADRIASLFGENAVIQKSFYPYTWKQADKSSCGPYSFANAKRALAGKGEEPNPGIVALRNAQLNKMTNAINIKSCSTHKEIDKILEYWIKKQVEEDKDLADVDSINIDEICKIYATHSGRDQAEIKEFIEEEYGRNRPFPIRDRLYEIISDKRYIEGIDLAIEKLRQKIAQLKGNELASYQIMTEIMHPLCNGDVISAEKEMIRGIDEGNSSEVEKEFLQLTNKILHSQKEREYLKDLAEKYGELSLRHEYNNEAIDSLREELGINERVKNAAAKTFTKQESVHTAAYHDSPSLQNEVSARKTGPLPEEYGEKILNINSDSGSPYNDKNKNIRNVEMPTIINTLPKMVLRSIKDRTRSVPYSQPVSFDFSDNGDASAEISSPHMPPYNSSEQAPSERKSSGIALASSGDNIGTATPSSEAEGYKISDESASPQPFESAEEFEINLISKLKQDLSVPANGFSEAKRKVLEKIDKQDSTYGISTDVQGIVRDIIVESNHNNIIENLNFLSQILGEDPQRDVENIRNLAVAEGRNIIRASKGVQSSAAIPSQKRVSPGRNRS